MKNETKRNIAIYIIAVIIFCAIITFVGVGYYASAQEGAKVLYWISGAITLASYVYGLVVVSKDFFKRMGE